MLPPSQPDNGPSDGTTRSGPDQLDEVVAAYLRAMERGENLNHDEILARHPELADDLREFFADHDRMNRLAQPLCEPTLGPPAMSATEHIRYFGDYEVLEEIARGGMGVVFKARQVTLNRIVAIKMILGGQLASSENVQRFQTEAEAAAKLDHPGIVPIYEVGQHEGQHYFSMGFVEGVSLSSRVANGPLPAREAAEIVRAVAEAVQYAHDNGVIHRDLKPGNILLDRQNKPRVTDFGLAKLTESGSDLTGTGQILGTPGYMPPEQAAAQVNAVGRLSDVYSLGAVLYCLLAGRPPFQAATPVETLLQVQNEEPVPPRQLNPAIPLDLNTLVLKCLDKSPGRRYATAQNVADELSRFLDGRPIIARPIGRIARLARWCRRKPTVAALSAAILVAIVVTITTLVISRAAVNSALSDRIAAFENLEIEERKVRDALDEKTAALDRERQARAAEAEQRAEVERQKELVEGQRDRAIAAERQARDEEHHAKESEADLQAFSDFLVLDVLAVARPERVQGGLGVGITVAQALEAAEAHLDERFAGRPLAEAIARDAIGKTFRNLDKYELAERHLRRAVELREQELPPDDPATLDSRNSLGVTLNQMGRHVEAIALHEEILKARQATQGADHKETLMSMSNLGGAFLSAGKVEQALSLLERTQEMMQEIIGPDHPETLRNANNLARTYQALGQFNKAVLLLQETLKKREGEFGPTHPKTLSSVNNLASAYEAAGNRSQALVLYEQALEKQMAILGPDNLDTLTSMNNLASAYRAAGQLDRALPLHEQTLERLRAKVGNGHPYTLGAMINLGMVYRAAGRLAEAEPVLREAVAGCRQKYGVGNQQTQSALRGLAGCYADLRQPEKAEPLCRELAAFVKERSGAESLQYAAELATLGLNLLGQKRPADAESCFRKSLLIREKTKADAWSTLQCKCFLIDSLLDQQKYSDAEPLLLASYDETTALMATIPATGGPDSPKRRRHAEILDRLIRLAEGLNKPEDVRKWQAEKSKLSKHDVSHLPSGKE